MTITARIFDNWTRDQLDVFLVEDRGGITVLIAADGNRVPIGEARDERVPSFSIPYGAEHALLGALSQQLGAVEHPLQLRSDFEFERKRVDKLIDALIAGPREAA